MAWLRALMSPSVLILVKTEEVIVENYDNKGYHNIEQIQKENDKDKDLASIADKNMS